MANALTAFNPAYWAKEMQPIFFKECVALGLANAELLEHLRGDGYRVYKPYRSYLASQAYTKGTDITVFNDLVSTEEYLDVDTARVVPFYVDDLKSIGSLYSNIQTKLCKLLGSLIKQVSYNGMPQMA